MLARERLHSQGVGLIMMKPIDVDVLLGIVLRLVHPGRG
jgi:hypothetical protein